MSKEHYAPGDPSLIPDHLPHHRNNPTTLRNNTATLGNNPTARNSTAVYGGEVAGGWQVVAAVAGALPPLSWGGLATRTSVVHFRAAIKSAEGGGVMGTVRAIEADWGDV